METGLAESAHAGTDRGRPLLPPVVRKPFPKTVLILAGLAVALAVAFASVQGFWKLYLLASAAMVGALVLFRYGHVVYLALATLLVFSMELRVPGAGAEIVFPTEVLIPILAAVAALEILFSGKFRWLHSPLNLAAGLFALAMVLTLVSSSDRVVSLKAIVRDLSYALAGFLLLRRYITTPGRLKALLALCAGAALAIALYGMYTQLREGVRIYQMIAAPFFREYSVYAAILAMDFAMLAAFVLEYRRARYRWLGLGVLGVWGFALALSFSRGAWLSLAALAGFYAILERRQIDLKAAIALILLVVLGAGLVGSMQLSWLFAARLEHLTDLSFLTNYDRIDRWMAALAIFQKHPLLGVGWGRYADEYFQYIYYTDAYSTGIRMGAHNLYLEMLAESGIAGIAAFALLMGTFYAQARRLRRRTVDRFARAALAGTMGAMLTYLVHAFVNNLGPSDKIGVSFWLLIGLVPVIGRLAEKPSGELSSKPCAF